MEETITLQRNKDVVKALYEIIAKDLDSQVAHEIFPRLGVCCADTYVKYRPIDTSSFEKFIKTVSDVPAEAKKGDQPTEVKHTRTVRKEGDVIYWDLHVEGKCVCHLVRSGFIELSPRLCMCSSNWVKRQISRFFDKPLKVELIDSPAFGGQDCKFKVTILGTEENPLYDSAKQEFNEYPISHILSSVKK